LPAEPFTPPRASSARRLAVATSALVGVAVGLGFYTFVYARGYSYLGHDSAACVNCHAMREQYSGWVAGSHRQAATCNDCHTPGNVIGKYAVKASNGFWHSLYFTAGAYPDPIRMRERNVSVTEQRCRDCHATTVAQISATSYHDHRDLSCITCHHSVGHLQ
jgi:cytochrome c nitrite reductase small subunit